MNKEMTDVDNVEVAIRCRPLLSNEQSNCVEVRIGNSNKGHFILIINLHYR